MRVLLVFALFIGSLAHADSAPFCQSDVARAADSAIATLSLQKQAEGIGNPKGHFVTSVSGTAFYAAPNSISKTQDVDLYTVNGVMELNVYKNGKGTLTDYLEVSVYTQSGTCKVLSTSVKVISEDSDD